MNNHLFPWLPRSILWLACCAALSASAIDEYIPPDQDSSDDVQIVVGEDKTVFEYRTNGILMMIKIVPRTGRSYYMVPADGTPHYDSLDYDKKLYPKWVILEW